MFTTPHEDLYLKKGALGRSHIPLLIHTLFVCLLISVPGSTLKSGTTGKITGFIRDALTGEGLVGANIIIEECLVSQQCGPKYVENFGQSMLSYTS